MVQIRALLLPVPEPVRFRREPAPIADVSLRPLRRGLVFLVALSLPVLGCATADWFHGSASRSAQVVAVPLIPPPSGAAAKSYPLAQARSAWADIPQARLVQAKFRQSLTLQ